MKSLSLHNSGTDPRLLHVIGAFAAGGAERFVVDLVEELRVRGFDVHLLALSSRRDASGRRMIERLEAADIPFAAGPSFRVGARTVLWYGAKVRRMQPHLVHLHTTNTELAHFLTVPWHRYRHKLVRTIHNTRLSLGPVERLAFRRLPVDVSIGCSTSVQTAHDGLVRGPVLSIPNGIRFDWAIRTAASVADAKEQMHLASDQLHYVSVGRMDGTSTSQSQKGHDLLILAWMRAHMTQHNARLHLIGDGPLRTQLAEQASADPGIIFWGIREDVPLWLQAADYFVMPSRWEGLPIAAIEAIGTGIRCLFSDIPSLRELQAPAAYFFPAANADALGNALLESVEAPQTFPAERAVHEFRARHGIAAATTAYERIYARLLK